MRVTQITTAQLQTVTLCPTFAVYWVDRRGNPGMWVFEYYQERENKPAPGDRYLKAQTGTTLRTTSGLYGTLESEQTRQILAGVEGVDFNTAQELADIAIAPKVWRAEYVDGVFEFERIYCTGAQFKAQFPGNAFEVKLTFELDPVTAPQS